MGFLLIGFVSLLLSLLLLCHTGSGLPLQTSFYVNECSADDRLIHADFEDVKGNFGYIYTLNSTSASLSADIDIYSKETAKQWMASKRAIALLSHIEFSEANSTLLLQAWISPTNKVKMKQSGRVAHLGFRIHTFDNKLQTWSSQSYSSTRVTAYVQTREDQQDQKLWLELTPDHTVQQHVWLPGENGQWVTWNMTCKNEQG